MKLEEIKNGLENLGFKVAYNSFSDTETPEYPYVIYRSDGVDNFWADGIIYATIESILIELYTSGKKPEDEKKIESWLKEKGLSYRKEEDTVESDKLKNTYTISIVRED